jgi:hypothetical protein
LTHLRRCPHYTGKKVYCKKDIYYGYAITVHKSQGSTYDNIAIDMIDVDKNKVDKERNSLKYVGLSRPKQKAIVLTHRAIKVPESLVPYGVNPLEAIQRELEDTYERFKHLTAPLVTGITSKIKDTIDDIKRRRGVLFNPVVKEELFSRQPVQVREDARIRPSSLPPISDLPETKKAPSAIAPEANSKVEKKKYSFSGGIVPKISKPKGPENKLRRGELPTLNLFDDL